MAVPEIDLTGPLEALCVAFRAAGVRSAETDPGRLNLPGVLVELAAIRFELLEGAMIAARVSLVAPDVAIDQVHELLADLLARVSATIDPDGDVIATRVATGEQSTLMPALQCTVTLPTTS